MIATHEALIKNFPTAWPAAQKFLDAYLSLDFDTMREMLNDSSVKVNEIAAASEEQSAQSQEVFQSIETVSVASQEAAVASEETAASIQSLAKLADELNESVAVFKLS